MTRTVVDPKKQEWWTFTDPCQSPLTTRAEGEKWAMTLEVFNND